MKTLRGLVVVSAVLLAGCANTLVLEDKQGATWRSAGADHQECHKRVAGQPGSYVPPQQNTLTGIAAAGVAQGAVGVLEGERAVNACMAQMGYTRRNLTPEEVKLIRAVPRNQREMMLNRFLASNDTPEQPGITNVAPAGEPE